MENKKIKAGIIGATGYAGAELFRLLYSHRNVEISAVSSTSFEGKALNEVYPALTNEKEYILTDMDGVIENSDVIFAALPHGLSEELAAKCDGKGKVLIDLGKVDYSCDKLIINGHDLGTRPMAPFIYEIDGKLLKEENELIVNIANTCANQFVTSKVLDKYPYEVIGPYHRIMQQFEGDFVESGLLGPVVIKELK